jgi:glycosyltransferase involved in cell wall biosynthesis
MHVPAVSVVTATYNRSNVLRYAIESVRWQTVEDWELLVVGDACTDDTEEVVRSFGDPRIHFHNLDRNTGSQSGPNNEGVARARAAYVAFLNHDDLWLPDHLERCLETIRSAGADLVCSLCSRIRANRVKLDGLILGHAGDYTWSPASCWLFRRTLGEEIGAWRHHRDIRSVPSQDWLWRVYSAGRSIVQVPWLTVVAVPSTGRARSYSERHDEEQRRLFAEITADAAGFRERLLTLHLVDLPAALTTSATHLAQASTARLFRALLLKVELAAWRRRGRSRPPSAWRSRLRARGSIIDRMRAVRGLDPR